jgi:hypothetical protein
MSDHQYILFQKRITPKCSFCGSENIQVRYYTPETAKYRCGDCLAPFEVTPLKVIMEKAGIPTRVPIEIRLE